MRVTTPMRSQWRSIATWTKRYARKVTRNEVDDCSDHCADCVGNLLPRLLVKLSYPVHAQHIFLPNRTNLFHLFALPQTRSLKTHTFPESSIACPGQEGPRIVARWKQSFSPAWCSKLTVAGRYNPHESERCGLFSRFSTTDRANHRSLRDSFAMDCLVCGQTKPGDRHDWFLLSPRGKMGCSACRRGIVGD